ncbi:DUF4059 family protein [Streptococcus suis]|uniref:DUF4059 family protein n=1 Tax=Streptococcus suis TaxID=1307 RepID=A0A9X4MM06_STRSU|nr:DUF4059 family protein [Streptococcus suis]MDG4516191.1 DUF4059 family protein [Streptococcus suis]MDG4522765.1 DUF4059 family protein [Streptococcus suis]
MLQNILSFYLQGLVIAAIVVVLFNICWFLVHLSKKTDTSFQERQDFLFDLLLISVMTTPIIAFGVAAILLMLKA